jgi:putative FmdB family regulatory protein
VPAYTYLCSKCSSVIDIIRPVDERDQSPLCMEPGCDGQKEMHRVLSVPSLSFKGQGWTPKHYSKGE